MAKKASTERVQDERTKMMDYIRSLSECDAACVLMKLLSDDPGLAEKAYGAAMWKAGGVEADDVMDMVYEDLNGLDFGDLNSRSGRTRYGYVDPNEAAWGMFEEQVEPYMDEMRKYQEHKLPDIAKVYCIGIIKGLMRYERESTSEISDWMTDAPGEFIDTVFEEWKKGKPSKKDVDHVKNIMNGTDR